MKTALLFLWLIPGLACGQNSKPAPTFQRLKARLIDFTPDKLCVLCGKLFAASIFKFEVVEGSQDFHKGQNILVVIPCAGDKALVYHNRTGNTLFEDRQDYLLTLYKPTAVPADVNQFHDLYSPYYEGESLPRFCSESLERL